MANKELRTLITGASGGIGAEFAYCAAQHGRHLILSGRDRDKLLNLKQKIALQFPNTKIEIIVKDLSEGPAAQELHEEIIRQNLFVEQLINCAGYQSWMDFEYLPYNAIIEQLNVNVQSVVLLTRLVYLRMIEYKIHGQILNVASTAGFKPAPYQQIYNAAKSFVINFSLGLRLEASRYKINVTCLCPGSTATGFFAKIDRRRPSHLLSPVTVARQGYLALLRNKAICIPSWRHKIQYIACKLLPLWGLLKITAFRMIRSR